MKKKIIKDFCQILKKEKLNSEIMNNKTDNDTKQAIENLSKASESIEKSQTINFLQYLRFFMALFNVKNYIFTIFIKKSHYPPLFYEGLRVIMSFMNKPIAKFGERLTEEEIRNLTVFGE